jgi:high-affinity iron transporter
VLASLIIVFREVLEASLVIGIVMAASRGVPRRGAWILGGCALGVLGACIVAGFAGEISSLVDGVGQELFNAAILLAAVAMLAWHNIWMSQHGRELAASARRLGKDVIDGTRPLTALALVCGIALLREGSEVVLFLYGIAVSGGASAGSMLLGGLVGCALGLAVGVALYAGLIFIPLRHLFRVTGALILLLAAGMASQAAIYLAAANVLPTLGNRIWDSSALLSETSLPGQLLHILAGYTARPAGIQLVFFVATLVLISAGSWFATRPPRVIAGATPVTGQAPS